MPGARSAATAVSTAYPTEPAFVTDADKLEDVTLSQAPPVELETDALNPMEILPWGITRNVPAGLPGDDPAGIENCVPPGARLMVPVAT